MAQILVPTSDQATGSWTTTPLWSKVDDDSTANPTGDGTLINSLAVGNNNNTTNADVKIATGTAPQAGTQTLRVRWQNNGEGGAGRDIIGHCELWEGIPGTGTMRAEVTPPTLTSAAGEVETTTSVTGITDYSDLYIRLWGTGSGGGPSRSLGVDLVELEIPDASNDITVSVESSNLGIVAVDPSIILGSLNTSVDIISLGIVVPDPNIISDVILSPELVDISIIAADVGITLGNLTEIVDVASVSLEVSDPSVVLSAVTLIVDASNVGLILDDVNISLGLITLQVSNIDVNIQFGDVRPRVDYEYQELFPYIVIRR